jgi:DNA-binding LytR/AlgR family response regulator
MINCIILEDEPAAREVLAMYIDQTPYLRLLGTYESGLDIPPAALKQADLLFLDIQLPGLNGLSFLQTLTNPPKVIVCTAFPDYAVPAFEEAVVDYLVKPYPFQRFLKAVERVRRSGSASHSDQWLELRSERMIYRIKASDVLFLKAEVDYVRFFTADQKIMVLGTLREWRGKLAGAGFAQPHRSYLIRLGAVDRVIGPEVIVGKNRIPLGKKFSEAFVTALG